MEPSSQKLSIFIVHPSEFLTDCKSHGDGLTAYGFIRNLAERGHRLHVAIENVELENPLPPNVTLYPIKTRTKGLVWHRLEYLVKSRLLLNRLRREHKIDLVHQLNPVNKSLSLGMIGTGLPVVLGQFYAEWPLDAEIPLEQITLLTRFKAAVKSWERRQILRLQQYFASALVISSPAARDVLCNPESVAHKTFLVPPGVNLEHFAPLPEGKGSSSDEPSILFLANLWRRKGIFTMLEAFEIIHQAMPECRLIVVGSGGVEEEVHRRAETMASRSQITFIKGVSREEMPSMVRRATVYCLPSYGEPLGNSALEAMACGKPIVGTNTGGLGHVIQAGGGRKVPPRNANALAFALLEILASPELQQQMGKFNRRYLEDEFAWDRVMGKLEAVYQRVLQPGQVSVVPPQAEVSSLTNV